MPKDKQAGAPGIAAIFPASAFLASSSFPSLTSW